MDLKRIYSSNKVVISYTIIFVITASIIFLPFKLAEKSFVWSGDGLFQAYATLSYISDYLRTFFSQLIFNHKIDIPMIDFNIGLGYDILTTLNYYGIGDPLTLLAVFFPAEKVEFLYNFLVLLHFYFMGLAFIAYCKYRSFPAKGTLLGAIAYSFCGFSLYAGVRHPYFMNPMIYLPILCIGAEKILQKKPAKLFSVFIAISAVSNYYFFYMLSLILFLYAMARYIEIRRNTASAYPFWTTLFRGIGYYLMGIAMSAVMFLPALLAFMDTSRRGAETFYSVSSLLYPWRYYYQFMMHFSGSIKGAGSWTFLSFIPIAPLCIVNLFSDKKGCSEKILFAVMSIMLFVPWIGHFMNGFSYVSNRWCFGYAFIVAVIIALKADSLWQLSFGRLSVYTVGMLSLFAAALFYNYGSKNDLYINFFIWALTLLIIYSTGSFVHIKAKSIWGMIGAVSLFSIFVNSYLLYSPNKDAQNYVKEFRRAGDSRKIMMNAPEGIASQINDAGFYRVDSNEASLQNQGMLLKSNGTSAYFSLIPSRNYNYFIDLEYSNMSMPFRFFNLNQRSIMESLFSVKYYTQKKEGNVPFGFEETPLKGLFYNPYHLPLGYTYETVITDQVWNDLNGIEREEAMVQGVYIEDDYSSRAGKLDTDGDITLLSSRLPIQNTVEENVNFDQENGILEVEKDNGRLKLEFVPLKNSEIFLRFENFDINRSGQSELNVKIDCGNGQHRIYPKGKSYTWYIDRDDYSVNLGYGLSGPQTCTITFPKKGTYDLGSLTLYARDMSSVSQYIKNLKRESLKKIKVSSNRITGSISVSKPKILCFSIPYNKGWSVEVDGNQTEPIPANVMFLAVPLEAGTHDIVLTYCTPGIKLGALLSLAGATGMLLLGIWQYRQKRLAQDPPH